MKTKRILFKENDLTAEDILSGFLEEGYYVTRVVPITSKYSVVTLQHD